MESDRVGTRKPSMIMELQRLMQRMMWLVKLCRMFLDLSTMTVVERARSETTKPTDAPQRVDLEHIR